MIDFAELGELLYEQSSGFVTKEDILAKLQNLPETPEAIQSLKEELKTNYQKYFRESFANKDFKDKWRAFEKLRNKIAHCNLFTSDDLEEGQRLSKEISEIISAADDGIKTVEITEEEKEAIEEKAIDRGYKPKLITEDALLESVAHECEKAERKGGFVGISNFLRHQVGWLGYSTYAAKDLIRELEEQGKIETYKVPNPRGEYDVTAIRIPTKD